MLAICIYSSFFDTFFSELRCAQIFCWKPSPVALELAAAHKQSHQMQNPGQAAVLPLSPSPWSISRKRQAVTDGPNPYKFITAIFNLTPLIFFAFATPVAVNSAIWGSILLIISGTDLSLWSCTLLPQALEPELRCCCNCCNGTELKACLKHSLYTSFWYINATEETHIPNRQWQQMLIAQ